MRWAPLGRRALTAELGAVMGLDPRPTHRARWCLTLLCDDDCVFVLWRAWRCLLAREV